MKKKWFEKIKKFASTLVMAQLLISLFPSYVLAVAPITLVGWTFDDNDAISDVSDVGYTGTLIGNGISGIRYDARDPGNSSDYSAIANHWETGDSWEIEFNALGYADLTVSSDHRSSGTGPGEFGISCRSKLTDWVEIDSFELSDANWHSSVVNFPLDESCENDSEVHIKWEVSSDAKAPGVGGEIKNKGTGRIDNIFVMSGSAADNISPVIDQLGDIYQENDPGETGALVTFATTATDDVDGNVPVTCDPLSDSFFDFGTTEVTCSATDSSGNTETMTFNVIVSDPVPATPTELGFESVDRQESYSCGDVVERQPVVPVWADNIDPDFSHYEYTSFHPSGSVGLNEMIINESEFFNTWMPPADGAYGFAVRAVDLTGNKSLWALSSETLVGSCQIVYETEDYPTAPVIISPSDEGYFGTTPILNDWTEAIDSDGIKQYQIEYVYDDGHTFSNAPYRYTDDLITQRNHVPGLWEQGGITIRVRALDNEDNYGEWSNSVHYYYDATSPSVPVHLSPADGIYLRTTGLTLIDWYDSTDNLSGPITYQYQSAFDFGFAAVAYPPGWLGDSQIPAVVGTPEGFYHWHVRARDAAGNMSTWSDPWVIHVDNTLPTVDIDFYLGTDYNASEDEALGFKVVFSEDVIKVDAENPANYYLTNWPDYAASNGDLVGDASIVYDSATLTATITFLNSGWYVSPEQLWGVQNIHDLAGNLQLVNSYEEYSTPMVAPATKADILGTPGLNGDYISDVTVNLNASDPLVGSGVKTTYYSMGGVNFIPGNSLSFTVDGDYDIWFYSVDRAGNTESINESINHISFTIDKTPPTTPIITGFEGLGLILGCGAITNMHSITVQREDSTDNSGIAGYDYVIDYPKLDGTGGVWSPFFSTPPYSSQYSGSLYEGTHYVKVKARDNTGLYSGWSNTCSITADWTAPDVTIETPDDSSTLSGTVDVRGSVVDNNPHHYWLAIYSNATNTQVAGPGTVLKDVSITDESLMMWDTTFLPDGEYIIKLEARDAANNKDKGSVDWHTVTVDNTAPDQPIHVFPEDGASVNPDVAGLEIDWEDDTTEPHGPVTYHYEIYSATMPSMSGSGVDSFLDISTLVDDDYLWRVKACDVLGNCSDWSDQWALNIDRIAPVITIDSYPTEPTNQDVVITATTDEGTLNETPHTFTENGCFTFVATDVAGNSSNEEVCVTWIDKVAPIITIDGVNPLDLIVGAVYVEAGATTDDGSDVVIIDTVDTSTAGTYTVTYNAEDDAGNIAVEVTRTVNVSEVPAPVAVFVPQALAAPVVPEEVLGDTDEIIEDANVEDILGTEDNVKGSSDKICPWWWIIMIILLGALSSIGGVIKAEDRDKKIRKYYYVWPVAFGGIAWVAHYYLHQGFNATWFCDNYWLVVALVVLIAEFAYRSLVKKSER